MEKFESFKNFFTENAKIKTMGSIVTNQTLATLNFKMKSKILTIAADYTLMRKKTTNSLGNIERVVPAFDMVFEAKSVEEARNKSIAMVKIFFQHYLDDKTNKKRLNELMINLTRFGFRAQI